MVSDRLTNQPTNIPVDIVIHRAAIVAKNHYVSLESTIKLFFYQNWENKDNQNS